MGEATGLAGGQRLHEEAACVCPRQLGRWLQSLGAQRGRLATGSERDVLRQLVLAFLLLFLLLVWGTRTRPGSARGGGATRPPHGAPAAASSTPASLYAAPWTLALGRGTLYLPLSGSRGFSEVARLANWKEGRGEGMRVLPTGTPPVPSADPPCAPRP